MSDNKSKQDISIEQLETDIYSLKIRLGRVEKMLHSFPNPKDYQIITVAEIDELFDIGHTRAFRIMDQLETTNCVKCSKSGEKYKVSQEVVEKILLLFDKDYFNNHHLSISIE